MNSPRAKQETGKNETFTQGNTKAGHAQVAAWGKKHSKQGAEARGDSFPFSAMSYGSVEMADLGMLSGCEKRKTPK